MLCYFVDEQQSMMWNILFMSPRYGCVVRH